jgi:hypothetical protein
MCDWASEEKLLGFNAIYKATHNTNTRNEAHKEEINEERMKKVFP